MNTEARPGGRAAWEAVVDPLGFRRFWAGVDGDDRRAPAGAGTSRWVRAAAQRGGDALELQRTMALLATRLIASSGTALFRAVVDHPPTGDPVELLQRWYGHAGGPLAELADDALQDPVILRFSKRMADGSAAVDKAVRGAAERRLTRLGFATSADVERVARLVVNLDDKIDQLQDELDRAPVPPAVPEVPEVPVPARTGVGAGW